MKPTKAWHITNWMWRLATEEQGGGDTVYIRKNTEEVESNCIYVGKIFDDEYEAYNTYNHSH